MQTEPLDHTNVLNYTTKYLLRDASSPAYTEPWRFPIVESTRPEVTAASQASFDRVTFVWIADTPSDNRPLSVVGTFDDLWSTTRLEPVLFDCEPTRFRAVTLLLPSARIYRYKFVIDGSAVPDPINPQRITLDNGNEWSRVFTRYCSVPVSLESWELSILARITNEILPFTEGAAKKFMDEFYFAADKATQQSSYRLEQPVGAVNFIDNVLAREERHRLLDYKICLSQIKAVLKKRYPSISPTQVDSAAYQQLYSEMRNDNVEGWDTSLYEHPGFFLQILRRHTFCGAFSHPKYGGNAMAAGWAYLAETYVDREDKTCFAWQRSIETPLGTSMHYFG
ncbi:hypothetical protein BH160DRAFT_5848 [Burkholderia sp. H160]|nr:hypothetical protein BH160DRAFT_5848 [Burkholderia sp. H160]